MDINFKVRNSVQEEPSNTLECWLETNGSSLILYCKSQTSRPRGVFSIGPDGRMQMHDYIPDQWDDKSPTGAFLNDAIWGEE